MRQSITAVLLNEIMQQEHMMCYACVSCSLPNALWQFKRSDALERAHVLAKMQHIHDILMQKSSYHSKSIATAFM